MEHAGAIFYNASSLLLDESATQNQLLERASVIAHETSHMWFGDLVTMRWFNDVWMKEVFANFMADKIVNPSFPHGEPRAALPAGALSVGLQVDRTAGTNAIRQVLGNLDEAGQMYGPIIYDKAPVVMRQLEMIMGARRVPRRPARVSEDAISSATRRGSIWCACSTTRTPREPRRRGAAPGSRSAAGRRSPPHVRHRREGRLESITLTQQDPMDARAGLAAAPPRDAWVRRSAEGPARLCAPERTTTVKDAKGLPPPRFVLPNGGGLGYGLFVLDDGSRDYLLRHIEDIPGSADPRRSAG